MDVQNADITKSSLQLMVDIPIHSSAIDYVIENNEDLTTLYKHIVKSHGFNNFYDLFLYVLDEQNEVRKNKDYANLKKVKRKVVRNGKEIEMTFYEDADNQDSESDSKPKEETPSNREAQGTHSETFSKRNKPNPKTLAKILRELETNIGQPVNFNNNESDDIKVFTNDSGYVIMISGIKDRGSYIELNQVATGDSVKHSEERAIIDLILEGIEAEKEIRISIEVSNLVKEFIKTLGFTETKEGFKMKKKDVMDFIGDLHDFV